MTMNSPESSVAGERNWPKITMYTTPWCGDCRASKHFLTRHGIPFEEIDIEEAPEAAEMVKQLNRGRRSVPTIVIEGGATLTEPTDRELGRALGVA
ncbi:MAG: glutaredoxin family protein [Dehalococcoidia bacterium]